MFSSCSIWSPFSFKLQNLLHIGWKVKPDPTAVGRFQSFQVWVGRWSRPDARVTSFCRRTPPKMLPGKATKCLLTDIRSPDRRAAFRREESSFNAFSISYISFFYTFSFFQKMFSTWLPLPLSRRTWFFSYIKYTKPRYLCSEYLIPDPTSCGPTCVHDVTMQCEVQPDWTTEV
jgi:hypothetical protein